MNVTFASALLCASMLLNGLAQTPPSAVSGQTSSTNPTGTNITGKASAASTNKVDFKELLSGASFTNSAGMIMVKISPTLWAGKYEVTQQEYQKVAGSNPSQFSGDQNPVDSISWTEAVGFCAALTDHERKAGMLADGFSYNLPTQAQWESLVADAQLKDAVSSESGTRSGTARVGSLAPNSLGLHDVRGNVQEWCLDPQDKPFRVLRGGAWDNATEVNLRPEFRWYSKGPDDRQASYGLRCILVGGGAVSTPAEN